MSASTYLQLDVSPALTAGGLWPREVDPLHLTFDGLARTLVASRVRCRERSHEHEQRKAACYKAENRDGEQS